MILSPRPSLRTTPPRTSASLTSARRKALVLTALVASTTFVACGSDGAASTSPNGDASATTGMASCTLTQAAGTADTVTICQELVAGVTASDIDALRQGCVSPSSQAQAQFRMAPCPHDHALGGCRITQAGRTVGNWYYKSGADDPSTPDSIKQLCALGGGTFVPA